MPSKRILIFSLSYLPLVGGAELAIKEITNRLHEYQFDMVTMRFSPEHPEFEAVGNIHVYRVGPGKAGYIHKILFIPRAVWKARKLHNKRPYNSFWAMMTNMLLPISILRLLGVRTPYALTLQDGDPFEQVFRRIRIRFFSPLLKYGFRHAAVIQVISTFLAEWPKRMGYQGRIALIPNGVDYRKFSEPSSKTYIGKENPIRLITTSRLVKKNGVGDVIEAMKLLPEKYVFDILGSGELEINLREQAKSLGGRVRFLGHVDHNEIPNFLHRAHIFIRPSLSEGFGSSFVEAMAAGLPVIATQVGGIPDFLFDPDKDKKHPSTGLFVKVHDPMGIAKQVERLMNNERFRETIITNARRLAKDKYDWNLIAKEMGVKVFSI